VLFVCLKNGGKSQVASGLMRKFAGNTVAVDSVLEGAMPGRGGGWVHQSIASHQQG
jgi:arsenate-mycothiol transferase